MYDPILWTMKIFLTLIHCLVHNELSVFLFISFAIMCSSTRWLPHLLILMCFSLSLWMPKEAKRHNLKKCSSKKIKFICPSLCICICTCIKVYLPNASVLVNSGLPGNCVLHSLEFFKSGWSDLNDIMRFNIFWMLVPRTRHLISRESLRIMLIF